MRRMVGPNEPLGSNPQEESPGQLVLCTGSPVTGYRPLDVEEPSYPQFAAAWRRQRDWDRETHFLFWWAALPLWPRAPGRPNRRELYAHWIASGRRHGLSDDEIAARICVEPDTLRRLGCLDMADAMTARASRWERGPLIVAVEQGETEPSIYETWIDPRLRARLPDAVVSTIREASPRSVRS